MTNMEFSGNPFDDPEFNPNEIQQSHFTISAVESYPEIKRFLREHRIPPSVIKQLRFLSIPDDIMNRIEEEYVWVNDQTPARLQFSLDDFVLAYIGAMHRWGVISYDKEILNRIHRYLDFDALLPGEITQYPADSILLLDTNILYEFSRSNPSNKEGIVSMIVDNPHLTFLLSINILKELQRLVKKLEWNLEDDIAINLEKEELKLVEFIDDFEGFQSANKTRRGKKKRVYYKQKKPGKGNFRGKWGQYLD